MQLHHVVDMVRAGNTDDPNVIREHLIFQSLQRSKAYMRDVDVVKVHRVLISLFNMPLPWLNPKGINFVVFERAMSSFGLHSTPVLLEKEGESSGQKASNTNAPPIQQSGDTQTGGIERGGDAGFARRLSSSEGDVVLDCQSVREDSNTFRMTSPFAFIIKQGSIYEPVHHVHTKRSGGFEDERFIHYAGSSRQGRALLDTVLRGCKVHEESYAADMSMSTSANGGRLCTSAVCMVRNSAAMANNCCA